MTETPNSRDPLRLGLPKGRMSTAVTQLLADAGMPLRQTGRDYRPQLQNAAFDVKLLKPQNVVSMLEEGSRDLGFAGADWVGELAADLVEILDTGLDPVRIVAAAPTELLVDGQLPGRPLRVASEYERLTTDWITSSGIEAHFVHSYGATEAFPPDDADFIVDNTATGTTLQQNGLQIFAELQRSSTRLYANRRSLERASTRTAIDEFVLLLQSVLDARQRAMLDVNVDAAQLEALIAVLPAMQQPTISSLHGGVGFAVRAAVPRHELPRLLPLLRQHGARDMVVSPVAQLLP